MEDALALVSRTIPFAFLDPGRRAWVANRATPRSVVAGAPVVLPEDRADGSVFIVARGSVELHESEETSPTGRALDATIGVGATFGERAALLEQPLPEDARAGETGADVLILRAADVSALVDESVVFAQALASVFVHKQKIFEHYRRFKAKVIECTTRKSFFLSDLQDEYLSLAPALHPGIHSPAIDVNALRYALLRLPAEVTRTTFYFLSDSIPSLYSDPDAKFPVVSPGKARRRSMWQLMPGKILVLVRDGFADVADLLACLCLYATEARKLRKRIGTEKRLGKLAMLVATPDPEIERRFLDTLPLQTEERAGIAKLWPGRTAERLREILLHHEDVAFDFRRGVGEHVSRASETWVGQIRKAAARIVDLDDPEVAVHVISSNTHSVGNCLSPWLASRSDAILRWGARNCPDLAGAPSAARPWGALWARKADLVYVTAARYVADNPEEARARAEEESAAGRVRLEQTAFTGIEVDLIDASRIRDGLTDPDVTVLRRSRPTLLVNVDYAFGEQADEILETLILLFGRRIRSVNVLGKAGALVGQRGDLLLPRATLLQANDELYHLPNPDLPRDLLASLADGRGIHDGPILTVAGTLLQDRPLLLLYKKIWRCAGLEMEGSSFARRILSAIETGLLARDVKTRFAYYVSDAPLEPTSTLVEALRPEEGVPPLYAITRAILNRILGDPTTA